MADDGLAKAQFAAAWQALVEVHGAYLACEYQGRLTIAAGELLTRQARLFIETLEHHLQIERAQIAKAQEKWPEVS